MEENIQKIEKNIKEEYHRIKVCEYIVKKIIHKIALCSWGHGNQKSKYYI